MEKKEEFQKRLTKFSINVIFYCRGLRDDFGLRSIATQLIRSATSVGANYKEANNSISEKEFRSKIYICRKEIEETKYWLDIIKENN